MTGSKYSKAALFLLPVPNEESEIFSDGAEVGCHVSLGTRSQKTRIIKSCSFSSKPLGVLSGNCDYEQPVTKRSQLLIPEFSLEWIFKI